MSRLISRSVIPILILMISIPVQAQPLWGETTSGMSPSQVISAVKGSRLIQDGDSIAGGGTELVRLDDLNVVGESFKVMFFFVDDKLTQATLNLSDDKSFSLALSVFDSLTDTLTSQYGKEISREVDSDSMLKKAEATWIDGKTNINLFVIAVGDNPAVLNVNYQTSLSTDAEEL